MTRRTAEFQTIRSEGGLLPPDLLGRIIDPKAKVPGTRPEDYGLPQGERLNEVITQSWNRLRKHWAEFRAAAEHLPATETGTALTNDKWSLPLLRELGFGPLPASPGPEINGRTYAINRFVGPVPIHLVGCNLSLDRRAAGVRGAAAANPHGLVQEFLNRSDGHLWALVGNGLRLRLLRDNQALSRQSFLEFDLEAMFAGEVFSDFVLLWLTAHATHFAPQGEAQRPETCWLEQWTKLAEEQGTRALGELRGAVERALQILGEGFTSHPKNTALRDGLRSGQIIPADLHGQLLRLVYRLIFLFVAEDRTLDGLPLLHPRDDSDAARTARERYAAHYGTGRLRDLAGKIKGSRHGDLWRQFQLLVGALSGAAEFEAVRAALALPTLGSFLWDPANTVAINDAELTNHDFLEALRHLAFTRQGKVLRPVDYKNLGAEELGGVYEGLLALTPQISADGARFGFAEFAGNERKTSGSYYTPDSLVQCLLDSALDPVVDEAIKGKVGPEAEQAILALKVCDPAVGSGHFLVGAAHRLARHLARVRALAQGDSEPSPLLYQHALRDVIGRCLYGVDINPMAAELCRVSLWLEALEPGKPLSFLDHHIRVGNSLIGATPELIAAGIPDDAFKPIEGDDPVFCRDYKKQNKRERESAQVQDLFGYESAPWEHLGNLAAAMTSLDDMDDGTLEDIREKRAQYEALVQGSGYLYGHLLADTWCAAFVWPKRETPEHPFPITTDMVRKIEENPFHCPPWMRQEIERLAGQYRFFHWHLEFPAVFGPQGQDGFDVVLGNPPWERVKIQEKEWFADRSPETAQAPNAAARKQLIAALIASEPALHRQFKDDLRRAEGESHFLRNSGRYPLCGRGDINVYTVFTEGMRDLLQECGRSGSIVPTGIATDDTTKHFFESIVSASRLVSLYDFENEEKIFPSVHNMMRFCLLTITGSGRPVAAADLAFLARRMDYLSDADRHFTFTPSDFALLNPNTKTCPTFRWKRDAELTKAIYRRIPVFVREGPRGTNPWAVRYMRMLDMANDSSLFTTQADSENVPLYEAKMVHHFDHRFASLVGSAGAGQRPSRKFVGWYGVELSDAFDFVKPEYWVPASDVLSRLSGKWERSWLLGWRDITNAKNERTVIAGILPKVAVGHTFPLLLPSNSDAAAIASLVANLSAFVLDYAARQKIAGSHLTYGYLNQIPIFPPDAYLDSYPCLGSRLTFWLASRVLELSYTAWDLLPFSQDCAWPGPPFRWDEDRRFLLRCELDAVFFHLYLPADEHGDWRPTQGETAEDLARLKASFPAPRDAVAYILDTFPIVRRKDEAKCDGDYRTKRVILEIYDAMQEAMRTREPYQTRLDPPPADPSCCHPPLPLGILAYGSLIQDPGPEIGPHIRMRIDTETPFPVEYARLSRTRGGAPTLAPHPAGAPVNAQILVLDDGVSAEEAASVLWRRETGTQDRAKPYPAGTAPNSVQCQRTTHPSVTTVLYTDFPPAGKIEHPTAAELAKAAIASVAKAAPGEDGITYLRNSIAAGIKTPLTSGYKQEVLRQTGTQDLGDALGSAGALR